jgi:hypothetical protein
MLWMRKATIIHIGVLGTQLRLLTFKEVRGFRGLVLEGRSQSGMHPA